MSGASSEGGGTEEVVKRGQRGGEGRGNSRGGKEWWGGSGREQREWRRGSGGAGPSSPFTHAGSWPPFPHAGSTSPSVLMVPYLFLQESSHSTGIRMESSRLKLKYSFI